VRYNSLTAAGARLGRPIQLRSGSKEEIEEIRRPSATAVRESSDEPLPFVDVELHQAFVSHFQKEGLASFLIHDIGAFHDFVDFERLLAERAQDIFSIIQQY
jgi:hypothetical protein